jgi:hypothetical protein
MPQIAKRLVFSESSSAISFHLRYSASNGILKSTKIKLGLSSSQIDLHQLMFFSWRLHIEMVEAKGLQNIITFCYLFKKERLSANVELTLHRVRIFRSVMSYACLACKFKANTRLLKLCTALSKQRLATSLIIFPKCILVRKLHMAFRVTYIYDHITKLCRQQAKVIQNHENANVHDIRKGEARQRQYKRLKRGGGKA